MKTVRITLDDALAEEVDCAARGLGITRSAFIRDALLAALANLKERELERRHRAGYERHPVKPGEFDAETRFHVRTELGSREEGLALLDLLDREN
jgi:metal-responsive CopG/Arc/MetJ family transcriptional regulator